MNSDFRTGRHVVYDLHAHIVLTTKYRKEVFTERVEKVIIEKAKECCKRNESELLEAKSDKNHMHLLVSYPPKKSLSSLIAAIKSTTSKYVREQGFPEVEKALWGKHFWSPSYCVVSTGGAPLEVVKKYIENQGKEPRGRGRRKSSMRD